MKKTFFISLAAMAITVSLTAQENFSLKVGSNEIFLLSEGQGQGKTNLLIGASGQILDRYTSGGTFPIATNAFLVKRHGKNILLDTGYGQKLFDNLASLGLGPEDIDEILLTHMHGDHIGGLLKEGERAFPNAKLVIGRAEHDYWMSGDQNLLPEDKWGNFLQARRVVEKYGSDLELVDPMEIDQVPAGCGIYPVEAYGHTPGHTGFMVVCGKNRIFIWGDLTHAMAVQMPHPEVAITYDIDPEEAVKSRLGLLRYISDNNIPVAGIHIPYPGMGEISEEGSGYRFTPFE
ncbi:MAG: MBL fold metallo-hydrolase [Alistipes sp.]|nr:MBL fold metallo-hydrolase [Alistipes sp.]